MVWAAPPPRQGWGAYLWGWAPWVGMLAVVRRLRARLDWGIVPQAAAGCAMAWAWLRVSSLVRSHIAERKYREWQRKHHLPKRDYTMAEIRALDGSEPDRPILVVIMGKVFNVSAGAEYYGKDGPYNVFAGRDATWLLAKGELELGSAEEMATPLTAAEQLELDGWYEHFAFKYEVLGDVAPEVRAS